MTVVFMLPGRTRYDSIPQAERSHSDALRNGLVGLSDYAQALAHAINLFTHCEGQMGLMRASREFPREYLAWQGIASREGVFQIFHFSDRMKGIRHSIERCPTLLPHIDMAAVEALETKFESDFASYRELRHAVAHSAELVSTAEHFAKNAFSGGDQRLGVRTAQPQVMQMLHGRTYTATRRGENLSIEMTKATLEKLVFFRDEYHRVFDCWHTI